MIYTLFVVLIVLAAILMVLVVLIQESKGGGWPQTSHHQMPLWAFARRPMW